MRARQGTRPGWWLFGLSATGVIASHALAYRLAVPEAHARSQTLASSGHGYWGYLVVLALAALAFGLGTFAARRTKSHDLTWSGVTKLYSFTFARLIVFQALAFMVVEGAERSISGGSIIELLTEPAIAVGLIVQVFVACLGALLFVAFASVVEAIKGRTSSAPESRSRTVSLWATTSILIPKLAVATGAGTLRGPPTV